MGNTFFRSGRGRISGNLIRQSRLRIGLKKGEGEKEDKKQM